MPFLFNGKKYYWVVGDKKLHAPAYDSEDDANRVAASRFEDFRVYDVDTKDFDRAKRKIKERMQKETGNDDKGMASILKDRLFNNNQGSSSDESRSEEIA